MGNHIGLYFPSFHFPSDEWAKLAALYWDKVYRIVPDGYKTPRDTRTVIALVDNEVLLNLQPEHFFRELIEITRIFSRFIEEHEYELAKKYSVANSPILESINIMKIEDGLRRLFMKTGLGKEIEIGSDKGWLGMHPQLVKVYMSALATTLADRNQYYPVTNEAINYFAVGGVTLERLAQVLLPDTDIIGKQIQIPAKPSVDDLESALAIIAIQTVMPKNINSVSIEKLMKIRERRIGKLVDFQGFLQKIIAQNSKLTSLENSDVINEQLKTLYARDIKPKVDELDEAIKSSSLDSVSNILSIETKVPPLLAGGLIAGVATSDPVVGVTAGIALGLLKIVSDKRKMITTKYQGSEIAYLMHVRDELATPNSAKETLDWLNLQARKFFYGI